MEDVHGPDWRTLVRDAPRARASNGEPVTEPPTDGDRPHRAGDLEDGRSAAGSSEVSPLAELQSKLEEQYNPTKGPLEQYRERARRIVRQLEAGGATVDVSGLQKRLFRAECVAAMLGKTAEEKRQWLRGQWKDLVTGDSSYPMEEWPERLEVVDEMCREAGDDPSAWADRIGGGRGTSVVGSTPPREAAAAGDRSEGLGPARELFPDTAAQRRGSAPGEARETQEEGSTTREDRILKLLERAMTVMGEKGQTGQAQQLNTVLKVSPNVKWPRLGDDATERDVE